MAHLIDLTWEDISTNQTAKAGHGYRTTGAIILTLPDATKCRGEIVAWENRDPSANDLTVNRTSPNYFRLSTFLAKQTTFPFAPLYARYFAISDGVDWFVFNYNAATASTTSTSSTSF